ncbi:hypothetical protein HNY73_021560 [Argiope bruennichi]|uniref:Uncharacterized protein n=1 Tax=Argiope bruennichi TaxID=94029 RepID=A0A8T0DY12_ARGBR|nr:hypothetical protein HNY73_021560 [Argiope bruennichi]
MGTIAPFGQASPFLGANHSDLGDQEASRGEFDRRTHTWGGRRGVSRHNQVRAVRERGSESILTDLSSCGTSILHPAGRYLDLFAVRCPSVFAGRVCKDHWAALYPQTSVLFAKPGASILLQKLLLTGIT